MQHSQRLDQRLRMLTEEVKTMTHEKERGERVWRERLQRCQRQLKAKEDEMSRQSLYFENFKSQLQQKLSQARDREQSLQKQIYTLEKQLLDMTVSAATGVATISAVRVTAGTLIHWEEQERLPSMRGEGEGEEEKNEERRRKWPPNSGSEGDGREKAEAGKTEKDNQQKSQETRLQGFILSLQEDLKVLLEREENRVAEQRQLMEQLQEAQENNHFLHCKVEEMKAEIQQVKLSESSLVEEVEEQREENHRLQHRLREPTNQTPSQSFTSPRTGSLSCSPAVCSFPSIRLNSEGSSGKLSLDEDGQPPAVSLVHHQDAAASKQNDTEDPFSSAKSSRRDSGSKSSPSLRSLSVVSETIDEFKLGAWCSGGVLNLEETPSEESDALRDAFRSLGLGEDVEALQKRCDHLEAALQHTQSQLQVMLLENNELKLQLGKQTKDQDGEAVWWSSREKASITTTCDGGFQSCPEDNITTQDNLVQALNQENRALAVRIQELLAHIELSEGEMKRERSQLREHISNLEEDRVRLEQDKQEQGCLITELTKKTEDDLNSIMELQQKLSESVERKEEPRVDTVPWQSEGRAGSFQQNNLEETIDNLVEQVLKGEEPSAITSSIPDLQRNNHDLLQNNSQSNLHVSSLSDQVDQVNKMIQSLKSEHEELSGSIAFLREQQREVALSVQTETEEKHQLTRTVWGLKEETDSISISLDGLKQEREHLSRRVCGLKDEREQLNRSVSVLKEEKEKLLDSLSSGKEELNRIMQSLQSLQTERDQLNQTVLSLKLERDELTNCTKGLKGQRDQEQSFFILQEDQNKLLKSVSSLNEEKDRLEHSVSQLKQEETQIMLTVEALKELKISLRTGLDSHTQETNQNQHLLNQINEVAVKTTETPAEMNDYAAHRERTKISVKEQSDLMKEAEALRGELQRSQGELDKKNIETKGLQSELCQSEIRREEAERQAAQAADKVKRLTHLVHEMEEISMENNRLTNQVKQLQSTVRVLVKEKTDTESLKAQIEEQYNIVTAQLKAKTVALEELNSVYMALKKGRGSGEDLNTVLVSLRTRYNDIRAKYDALTKKKSQADLDTAPLKAKISCLVVKCQERNSALVQMMKAMPRHDCVDSALTQQVEQLLSDAALDDYTAAFTQGSYAKTLDYTGGFTPGFILKFKDNTSGLNPDHTYSAAAAALSPVNHQEIITQSGGERREEKSAKQSFKVATESTTKLKDCSSDVISPQAVILERDSNSPVPSLRENTSVKVEPSPNPTLEAGFSTSSVQMSPPAGESDKCPDRKAESFPVATSLSQSSRPSSSPAPPLQDPPVSLTRMLVSPARRLSSPEKILNLQEQLQQTLTSSYQAPVSRGRGQQPRTCQSFSAPASSQTKQQSLRVTSPPLPVIAASCQAKHTPAVPAKPVAKNPSTLFNAVTSRSANVAFGHNMLTNRPSKAVLSSSSNFTKVDSSKPASSSGMNIPTPLKQTMQTTTIPGESNDDHTASSPRTPRTSTLNPSERNPKILTAFDTNPDTTASNTAAPKADIYKLESTAPAYDGLLCTTSLIQSAHRSPERSLTSTRKSPEMTKPLRPQPEAPAEVRSVEVIKTVGQSSLMIGWERPPLDELGCSNGTFVYGYRVFVDGDFYKSVMSSACTKCVLENVDLSIPVQIGVKTLGSNGLTSHSVCTLYSSSVRTDH